MKPLSPFILCMHSISDSWLVEIHVKNRAVETFCYGVLVSNQHVLTSHECLWTRKQFLGTQPVAKFPNLGSEQPSINFKSDWQSNWAGSQDKQYGLALFELERPLTETASSNFTPICLPASSAAVPIEDQEATNCQLCPVEIEEGEDCIDAEARIPGKPCK